MAALVRSVREGLALLDDVVDQHPNWTRLESRMRGYMDFERLRRRGASRQKIPWWTHAETVGAGLRLRIAGVNTVLVTNGEDRGKLVVGEDQLSHLFATTVGPKDLVIALSHHPTSGGWLADEDGVAARLRMSAHVHLHGRMPEVGADEAKASTGPRWRPGRSAAARRPTRCRGGIATTTARWSAGPSRAACCGCGRGGGRAAGTSRTRARAGAATWIIRCRTRRR
jgi:hypothetical protein